MSNSTVQQIKEIAIEKLVYDYENPRLPLDLHGKDDRTLANHYNDTADVRELAESMLENGFFAHEPLIVIESEQDGFYTVVEGNRRLTALRILHRHPSTEDLASPALPLQKVHIERTLSKIPCAIIHDRKSIRSYIGFRHIGGQKTWPSSSKARYIKHLVDEEIASGVLDPFKTVGKKVGHNATGVKGFYIPLMLLEKAEEHGINTAHVESHRFGTWRRISTVTGVKEYIKFSSASSYEELQQSLQDLDFPRLQEVIQDLTPREGETIALLNDSRDANSYGLILQNAAARETLRKERDFLTAKLIVQDASLAVKLDSLTKKVDALKKEVENTDAINEEVFNAVQRLFKATRSLKSISNDLYEGND